VSDSEKTSAEELSRPDGSRIAYRKRPAGPGGAALGLVFAGGFRSDMGGTKAEFLDRFAARRGLAYLRFDPLGHGASSGRFEDGTIGRWIEDLLAVLDLTEGRQILIGSSMGAWLACHAALARSSRVAALVGIAPALDFTERLIWPALPPDLRQALLRDGVIQVPSDYGGPYPITRALIEEGRRHLLLDGPIALAMPVRLLHGMADKDVPYRFALDTAARIAGGNVQVRLIKDADHRLSRDADLALLADELDRLLAQPG
jgi:pimeloyl-ACP methyl ester carboxylesterase